MYARHGRGRGWGFSEGGMRWAVEVGVGGGHALLIYDWGD